VVVALEFTGFIPQNIALPTAGRIGIYNEKGNRVGFIPLNTLTPPSKNRKLYSFGAVSDVHIVYETAPEDFQAALTYLNEREDVEFICICGDLTDNGTAEQLAQYKAIVDEYSANTPIYAIAGNHEKYSTQPTLLQQYTGRPLYYSFEHGNDVYLMLGCYAWADDGVFTPDYLQWVYETLEVNRNKRCFVFQHVFPWNDSGNACELYPHDMFAGTKGSVFQSLLRHYKNTVFFHGHSHLKFYLQQLDETANYSEVQGYRSVHIPSLSVPRDRGDGTFISATADSEGYVVDVYENGIHLRGRDFVKGEFLPIASYWLDTTLQTIPAGTYTDPTEIIKP
jgi:predicted phosphodiesterase